MFKDPCTIALEHDKQLMAIHNAEQSPNDFDLFHLKENYVNHIIDGMDIDCLVQLAHDMLMDSYEKLTWDEVTEEIVDLYDCLLYTSPSPRDVEESRMPSSA